MKLLLQGYKGKMGGYIYEHLKGEHEFIGLVDMANAGKYSSFPLPECVIDFSSPQSALLIAKHYLPLGIPVIIGTTGLTNSQMEELAKLASMYDTSVQIIANFDLSLGELIKALKCFKEVDKAVITDYHHSSKRDSPSGTALYLGSFLTNVPLQYVSIRRDKYEYKHVIRLYSGGTIITLTHEVHDKRSYLLGVNKAISKSRTLRGISTSIS